MHMCLVTAVLCTRNSIAFYKQIVRIYHFSFSLTCFRDRMKKAMFLLAHLTEIKIGKEKYSRKMLSLPLVVAQLKIELSLWDENNGRPPHQGEHYTRVFCGWHINCILRASSVCIKQNLDRIPTIVCDVTSISDLRKIHNWHRREKEEARA